MFYNNTYFISGTCPETGFQSEHRTPAPRNLSFKYAPDSEGMKMFSFHNSAFRNNDYKQSDYHLNYIQRVGGLYI